MPSPPPPFSGMHPYLLLLFFAGYTQKHLPLLWDEPMDLLLFFRMHSSISSFSYPKPHPLPGPVAPRPIGNYSLRLLTDPSSSTCPKGAPKTTHWGCFWQKKRGGDLGEGAERFPRLPFHAAFPEQPHPGSPNLMAAFLWSGQDGEGERLEKGGERKQGNASEVRRFFFWPGPPCFVRLPPARCHFPEAGELTKKKKKWEVSLCLILAVAASAERDPAARSGNGCEPRGRSCSRE